MPTLMRGKNPRSGIVETLPVPDCFIVARLAMGYELIEPNSENARAATPRLMKAPGGKGANFGTPKNGEPSPETPAAKPETAKDRAEKKNGANPDAQE